MSTTSLVTGASGHLGVNLVRALLDAGHEVVALVRSTSNLEGLTGLPISLRYGDLLDPDSLRAAAEGCDLLFHAGAVHRIWDRDPERAIVSPAVEGTRNAIEAAAHAGVKRVIYTSSSNTVGFSRTQEPLSEADYEDARRCELPYVRAKILAERLAFDLAERLGLELVALNPTGIMGPGDYRITPTTVHAQGMFNGTAPVFASGGVNLVDARDVARAHVLAAERGRPGERYIVGGENLTWAQVADEVERLVGKRPKTLRLGRRAVRLAAGLMELGARLTGKAPGMTRAMVDDGFGRFIWFDVGKAQRELGFEAAGAAEVLRDTLRWLLAIDALDAKVARRLARDFQPLTLNEVTR